jgi:hypothetical protein
MTYIDEINNKINLKLATAYEIGLEPAGVQVVSRAESKAELLYGNWEIHEDADLAIKRNKGIEATFHAYWDGEKFSGWVASINDNWLFAGQQGIEIHSNCSTIFAARCKIMDKYFDNLKPMLVRENFKGYVNIEVTFDKKKPAYRDIYFGATILFTKCLEKLYGCPEEDLIVVTEGDRPIDRFVRGFAAFARVYAYPYRGDLNAEWLAFVRQEDCPELIWDVDSYVVIGKEKSIAETWGYIYRQLASLNKYGICYRIDGDKKARQNFQKMKQQQII